MSELASQWRVTPNTVSRRLAYLNIKPVRRGNFRFITAEEWQMANAFHHHISQGKPMEDFSRPAAAQKTFCQSSTTQDSQRISKSLRYAILERDGFACKACGAKNCLEIDHIIPRSKGGPTIESNLQVLCADCNRGKGASAPEVISKEGISIKDLETKWSISRNTIKERAKILDVNLIRVSSTLTVWPHDKLELGEQLHSYMLIHSTSHGFYGRKNTVQFNIRLDSDLIEKFKACAYSRGIMLGLDRGQSVNRAMQQAMKWYIDTLPS
jgi:5-methylcytosine-specific restriction endonuclease McrA